MSMCSDILVCAFSPTNLSFVCSWVGVCLRKSGRLNCMRSTCVRLSKIVWNSVLFFHLCANIACFESVWVRKRNPFRFYVCAADKKHKHSFAVFSQVWITQISYSLFVRFMRSGQSNNRFVFIPSFTSAFLLCASMCCILFTLNRNNLISIRVIHSFIHSFTFFMSAKLKTEKNSTVLYHTCVCQ